MKLAPRPDAPGRKFRGASALCSAMPSETVCADCGASFYSAAAESPEAVACPQCGGPLEPAGGD